MSALSRIYDTLPSYTRQHLAGMLITVLLLICGVLSIPRLGVSWDEPVQHHIGRANYTYITRGDTALFGMKDRVYGPIFELALVYAEETILPDDSRSIYLFRHYTTFALFCLAAYVFYALCLRAFKSRGTALAGMLLLVLCPRILGHSYFNTKDIPFLCLQIFSMYALYRAVFEERIRIGWWLIFAVFTGILINIRIMGVATWSAGLGAFTLMSIYRHDWKKLFWIPLFILLSAAVLYAGWPLLWQAPFKNFALAYNTMAHFPWEGTTRLFGEDIMAGARPVYYALSWMRISIPVLSIALCIAGLLFLLLHSTRFRNNTPLLVFGWIQALCSWGVLFIVLQQRSVLYDDWRHLYFLWPGFIWNAVGFLHEAGQKLRPRVRSALRAAGIVYALSIVFSLIRLFPYHYVYFNESVPSRENYRIQQFEMDYWGLSYYEGIRYILAHDPRPEIHIMSFTQARVPAFLLLKPEEKRAQNAGGIPDADYLLTITRFHRLDAHNLKEFPVLYHSIYRGGSPILQIWKKQ